MKLISTTTLLFGLLLSGCTVYNMGNDRTMPDNVGNSQVVYQQQGIMLLFIDEQHFSRLAQKNPDRLQQSISALKTATGVSEQFDYFIKQFLNSRVFYGDRWPDYMASSLRFYVEGDDFDTPGFMTKYRVLTSDNHNVYRGFNYSKGDHALTISLANDIYTDELEFILPLPNTKHKKTRPDIIFKLPADAVTKSLGLGSD